MTESRLTTPGCGCGAPAGQPHSPELTIPACSPGSTIRAMAGALGELAELLSRSDDRTAAAWYAARLVFLADHLPAEEGGAADEVRHE